MQSIAAKIPPINALMADTDGDTSKRAAGPAGAPPLVSPLGLTSGPLEGVASLEGTLPAWLHGRLLRTAPAVFEHGIWRANHWFDGLGMLYSFVLESTNRVTWTQSLLESEVAAHARRGRVPVASFGSPNQRSFWRRLVEPKPKPTDNANVNVVKMGDDWVAMTESPYQHAIMTPALKTRGPVAYADALPAGMFMTAHPHFDRERNLVVNLGTALGRVGEIIAFDHDPKSRTRREIGRFSRAEVPYLHSFGVTPHEVMIVGHPWTVRPASMLWSNRGFADHFRWKQEAPTEIVMLGRESGAASSRAPEKYEVPAMFVFHTVNAFRDGEDRVLDVLAYPDARIVADLALQRSTALPALPTLRRIRMKTGGQASVETLSASGFEFPAINYREKSGRKHRYVWGSTASGDGRDVVKVDGETGVIKSWGEAGYLFGEPVFVGRPSASDEDDGVLLVVGSSPARTVLAVLDARTLEPHALARIDVPTPLGFHGSFARS